MRLPIPHISATVVSQGGFLPLAGLDASIRWQRTSLTLWGYNTLLSRWIVEKSIWINDSQIDTIQHHFNKSDMTGQKRKLIFLFTSRISQQLNISTIQSRMMTIQEIKTIQISDFLANKGYEPVSKKGSKWWYLSPLHSERTASFKVDQTKNLWYDFDAPI